MIVHVGFYNFIVFQLVSDYLRDTYYSRLGLTDRDIDQLNIAACRLMLDILPGLETSVVFQVCVFSIFESFDIMSSALFYFTNVAAFHQPIICYIYCKQNNIHPF